MQQLTCLKTQSKYLVARLSEWFAHSARQLPWRETFDPYHVWVAETMLQQTTMAACVPYFQRFIQKFPTLEALAAASEEEVLALWAGLGYYTRARNLLKAARIVMSDLGGRIPETVSGLRRLPGIGEYTAGAISAIAFERPSAMVDANVRRVIGRMMGIPPDEPGAEGIIRDASQFLSCAGSPRTVNQGLMELGSLLCLTAEPKCGECPFQVFCAAAARRQFMWYGSIPKTVGSIKQTEVAVLARYYDTWLLSKPRDGRWAGMWEFPRTIVDNAESSIERAKLLVSDDLKTQTVEEEKLGSLHHKVTKYDITLEIIGCRLTAPPLTKEIEWRLAGINELQSAALPSPMRKMADAYIINARRTLFVD